MTKPLRALIIEDKEEDVELMLIALRWAGYDVTWKVVQNADELTATLHQDSYDVILSDYSLPRFNAPEALRIVRKHAPNSPFIIVSGSVSEEIAVEAMRAGAQDFFSKSRLTRLAAAIEREIHEAKIRKERTDAVHKLRHAEEAQRLVLENVKDYAIFMLDADGKVATWNRAASRIFGYEEAEIVGRHFAEFFVEEERERADQNLRHALEHGFHHDEGMRLRKDGRRIFAQSSIAPISVEGEIRGYSSIIQDVSEKRKLLEELRQAIRARDEFLSIASHELKTPLTSLQLQVEGLERLTRDSGNDLSAEKLAQRLEVISRQTSRLALLINNLLDVTRITSGRMEITKRPIDLRQVVEDVLDRFVETLRRAGSEVHLRGPKSMPGEWDRMRLETVLTNLISNAIKYGNGKPIEIHVESEQNVARVSVRDGGIGISPEQHARVFERFERAVPEHHYEGLGLGLWIVRHVVEAHGGNIRVQSAPGEGSTFTVELPRN